jgi:uroporphyrinogen-III synthase
MSVPIYRWALPDDLGPLRQLLETILAGEIAVWLVTNAAQVEHCVRVLSTAERIEAFRKALSRMLVASIGPTASEHLRQYAFPVDLEPSHPKMGLLVKEASEQAATILAQKRQSTT